jgi:hypothetical protein
MILLTSIDKWRLIPLPIDRTAILDPLATQTPTIKTSKGNTVDLLRMVFNNLLIAGIILHTEEAISSMVQIDDFQIQAPINSNSHLQLEVVVVTLAIYNGLRQEPNEAAHRVRLSTQVNRVPCTLLPRFLIGHHKNLLQILKRMIIPFDLQKIFKWRMKRRTRWLHQGGSRVMTIKLKMLRNFPLRSNRKHLLQLQLNLHQIYHPG